MGQPAARIAREGIARCGEGQTAKASSTRVLERTQLASFDSHGRIAQGTQQRIPAVELDQWRFQDISWPPDSIVRGARPLDADLHETRQQGDHLAGHSEVDKIAVARNGGTEPFPFRVEDLKQAEDMLAMKLSCKKLIDLGAFAGKPSGLLDGIHKRSEQAAKGFRLWVEFNDGVADAQRLLNTPPVLRPEGLVRPLLDWFAANARPLPWRQTDDPYAIWISEVMLQQTQVQTVIPYWLRWMKALPNVHALARARPERILKLWEGLGYYTRVRNVHRAARVIVKDYQGVFPSSHATLLTLPGIGRYTAGAICSIAFNQPSPILDGNVTRVVTRLFGIRGPVRSKRVNDRLWRVAEDLVRAAENSQPPKNRACSALNQALMELGATICRPQQPQCAQCPVQEVCVAHRTGAALTLPNLGKRPRTTERRFVALVWRKDEHYLVRRRSRHTVNAQLWEFPNFELDGQTEELDRLAQAHLECRVLSLAPFCTVRHSITRFRIRLDVYQVDSMNRPVLKRSGPGEWLTLPQLQKRAFPSAHRKIVQLLSNGRTSAPSINVSRT
jgi:A/G-specific adenine glycosylase